MTTRKELAEKITLAEEFQRTWKRALNESSFMKAVREHPAIASDFGKIYDKIKALESDSQPSALEALRKKVKKRKNAPDNKR